MGAVAILAVASGCSGPAPDEIAASAPTSVAPQPNVTPKSSVAPTGGGQVGTSLVAEPSGPTVDIYGSPGEATPLLVLPNPWLLNGVSDQPIPQALLVLQTRSDGWVEVQLPARPNGSQGWLPPGSAHLLRDGYRIEVSLQLHRITVLRDGSQIYAGPVATGAPGTPTPVGLFYIRVLLHTTDPSSVYGPYAYGLSAHSEALTSFDGGDAEIGIHGNNDASVLGQSVTHGCVRIDNAEISQLAGLLPLGTPVQITA
jgi:lipoprotein-anchoring transpeptidase ErfK/SrfK